MFRAQNQLLTSRFVRNTAELRRFYDDLTQFGEGTLKKSLNNYLQLRCIAYQVLTEFETNHPSRKTQARWEFGKFERDLRKRFPSNVVAGKIVSQEQ